MQTLVSAFDDRDAARKAVERLVRAGFTRADVHLRESAANEAEPADRGVLESIGHFFVSIFGVDDGQRDAERYTGAMQRGQCVVVVDAKDDSEAETAAAVLHDCGAVDVDDQPSRVQRVDRGEQPRLRDIIGERNASIENDIDQRQSELGRSAGRVTLQRQSERAVAANDPVSGDRPGYDD